VIKLIRDEFWFNVCSRCEEIALYMLGQQRALFPYFALHDHVHCRNVLMKVEELLSVSPLDQVSYAVLRCATALHDIGMALTPLRINKLKIEADYLYKGAEKKFLKELQGYREFFTGKRHDLSEVSGVVLIPEDKVLQLGGRVADFIRLIHPWTGAKFVRDCLSDYLQDLFYGPRRDYLEPFVGTVSEVIRMHNTKSKLQELVYEIGGFKINTGFLAALLSIGDSLDFSRERAKIIFDELGEALMRTDPSQLKHWIFKMGVKDVHFENKSIVIRVKDRQELIFGVLFFELAENVIGNFQRAGQLFPQLKFNFLVDSGRGKVDITDNLNELININNCIKEIQPTDVNIKDIIQRGANIFDEIAIRIFRGEPVSELVKKAVNNCPSAGKVLVKFSPL